MIHRLEYRRYRLPFRNAVRTAHGLWKEREGFLRLVASDQSKARQKRSAWALVRTWSSTANPPLCPHGIMNCTITSITLTGAVSAAQTNIQNNMGITGISADAQGAS